jgi:hypothetical protein
VTYLTGSLTSRGADVPPASPFMLLFFDAFSAPEAVFTCVCARIFP